MAAVHKGVYETCAPKQLPSSVQLSAELSRRQRAAPFHLQLKNFRSATLVHTSSTCNVSLVEVRFVLHLACPKLSDRPFIHGKSKAQAIRPGKW